MAADYENDDIGIPLDSAGGDASEPQPVPVPVPVPQAAEGEGEGPQPVPVPVPPPKVEEPEVISLVEDFDETAPTQRKAFGAAAQAGSAHRDEFKRPMNLPGKGATRCRLFNSKIAIGSLTHMENSINEWLDNDEIEVKHVGQSIGVMEGKRAEPNLLVLVWY